MGGRTKKPRAKSRAPQRPSAAQPPRVRKPKPAPAAPILEAPAYAPEVVAGVEPAAIPAPEPAAPAPEPLPEPQPEVAYVATSVPAAKRRSWASPFTAMLVILALIVVGVIVYANRPATSTISATMTSIDDNGAQRGLLSHNGKWSE